MIVPLEDYMILELVKEQESLIALPDIATPEKQESAVFEIKSMGPGYYTSQGTYIDTRADLGLRDGDKIILAGFSLARLEYKREKILIARARDVALVVREDM